MKRWSKIYSISDNEFIDLVNKSYSISDIVRYFGLSNKGRGLEIAKNRIKELNIDIDHITNKSYLNRRYKRTNQYISAINYLINGSSIKNQDLKYKLIKEKILEDKCAVCGVGNIWNNLPLVLQLDHINGINNDNRLKNLRIICPNCHTQTPTFSGKSSKKNNRNKQ